MHHRNTYHSSLSTSNQIYSRHCNNQYLYYASIQMKIKTTGYYNFHSYSLMNAYGSIYKNTFNPLDPSENLLDADDEGGLHSQIKFHIHLKGGMTYVLVMTTGLIREIGAFSIVVSGIGQVLFDRPSKYIYICVVE